MSFAPYLDPFSSETFASAPLVQPLLHAVGPFLVTLANGYAVAAPSLTPLAAEVESLENQGYALLSPLRGPDRSQFLSAESALATGLAPAANSAADNQAAACEFDIESALTAAASAG